MSTVDKVKELCKERGIPISRLERECGFSNGYIRNLREGKLPSDRLSVVSAYLGVSVEFLLGEDEPQYYLNPETARLAQEMFEDKDMRALFDMKRNMEPEKFKAHMDMMKRLYELEHGDDSGC